MNYNPATYIVRQEVLDDLRFNLRHQRHVTIRGNGGSGKTALLEYILHEKPFEFEKVTLLNGPQLSFDVSPLTGMLIGPGRTEKELILIDDFEDLVPDVVQDMVLQLMKEGRKYGKQVILTNRRHMNRKAFDTNSGHVYLRGFSHSELSQYFGHYVEIFAEFKRNLSGDSFSTPLFTSFVADLIKRGEFSADALSKLLHLGIDYKNLQIIEAIKSPELLLPSSKKIISDIRIVNTRVLDKIGRNPQTVFDLQSREFEQLVAELFEEKAIKSN